MQKPWVSHQHKLQSCRTSTQHITSGAKCGTMWMPKTLGLAIRTSTQKWGKHNFHSHVATNLQAQCALTCGLTHVKCMPKAPYPLLLTWESTESSMQNDPYGPHSHRCYHIKLLGITDGDFQRQTHIMKRKNRIFRAWLLKLPLTDL